MADATLPERDLVESEPLTRGGGRPWWLLIALFASNAIVSAFHFIDNIAHFSSYPGPDWVTRFGIARYWVIMTFLGALGMYGYRRGRLGRGCVLLCLYGAMSLVVLGHYFYPSPLHPLSFKMHLLIIGESVTSLALITGTVWFYRRGRGNATPATIETHR